MARSKEVKLSPVKESALLDELLTNGCTLGQARRALKALKPGAHVLDRAEWERVPWSRQKKRPSARADGSARITLAGGYIFR